MAVNIELLDKALKIIREHPEHWNQRHWHCGTSHCLAGHVQIIVQGFPYDIEEGNVNNHWDAYYDARDSLAIDKHSADVLFNAHNTLDDLLRYRDILAEKGHLYEIELPY